jgi:hypothetical protein
MLNTYDVIFPQQTLRMKGSIDEWRALIHNLYSGRSDTIKVIYDVGKYIPKK